jgi:hypothetical protein
MRRHDDHLVQRMGGAASARIRRREAVAAYRTVLPLIRKLRGRGLSLGAIAARLNQLGHTTRTGTAWSPMTVWRVLARTGG